MGEMGQDLLRLKDRLVSKVGTYLDSDPLAKLQQWREVGVFLAPTLSQAWMLAKPDDTRMLHDERFKSRVDSANGKWLEPRTEREGVKVILAVRHEEADAELAGRLVHELTHACLWRDGSKHVPVENRHPGTEFFVDCSEFRAVYSQTRFMVLEELKQIDADEKGKVFKVLSSALGARSADAVAGIMAAGWSGDLHGVRYFMARYVGASRAIRDIDLELDVHPLFQLWHMTPSAVREVYHMAFYLGNEWSDCELTIDSTAHQYYYSTFLQSAQDYIDEGGCGRR